MVFRGVLTQRCDGDLKLRRREGIFAQPLSPAAGELDSGSRHPLLWISKGGAVNRPGGATYGHRNTSLPRVWTGSFCGPAGSGSGRDHVLDLSPFHPSRGLPVPLVRTKPAELSPLGGADDPPPPAPRESLSRREAEGFGALRSGWSGGRQQPQNSAEDGSSLAACSALGGRGRRARAAFSC